MMMRCKLFVRAVTLIIFAAGLTTAPAAELDVPAAAPPAEDGSPSPDEMGPPAPAEPPLLMRKTMETHVVVSHGLERMARRIDSFFAADQAFEESTRSYARLRFDTILDQHMQISFDGDVRVRIDLPRTERKLKLLIESDTRDTTDPTQNQIDQPPVDAVKRPDYLISVEQVQELNAWDVRPAAGIKLRWIPDPFVRIRATRYHDLDGWLMRTAGNLFWFVSDGAGATSTLDFDHAMGETALFRSGTTLRWAETDQFLTAEQLMSIYQRIDPRRYVVYQVGAVATRDPDWAMQQYFVAVHFRKNVYKNWLFMEVIPQINYTVDRDFRADPTLTFRIEGVFGQEYL